MFCQCGEGPGFAVVSNMLIVEDLAQFPCMIVPIAEKLDLLTDIDTALGECEGSQAFLVLLVDLLGQRFISLLSGSCLPLFQAMWQVMVG